jgi:hypothetical protein
MAKSGGTVLATSTTVTGFVQNFKLKSAAYARRQSSNKNNKLYASSMDVSESIEMMPVYQGMSSRYRISQPPKLDTLYVSNKNVPNTIPLEITAHHPLASKSASANRSASFGVRRCFRLAGDDSASVVVVVVASSVAFDCRCARVAVIARLARVPPRQAPSFARARERESRIAARVVVVVVPRVVVVVVVVARVVVARARRVAPYDVDARVAHLAHLAHLAPVAVAVAPVVIVSTVASTSPRSDVGRPSDRPSARATRAAGEIARARRRAVRPSTRDRRPRRAPTDDADRRRRAARSPRPTPRRAASTARRRTTGPRDGGGDRRPGRGPWTTGSEPGPDPRRARAGRASSDDRGDDDAASVFEPARGARRRWRRAREEIISDTTR